MFKIAMYFVTIYVNGNTFLVTEFSVHIYETTIKVEFSG